MNEFLLALRQFFRGFRCWTVVSPWELGLRVRKGRDIKLLDSGFHLKIPILDVIYLQSVRMRVVPINKQTLTTACGKVVTLTGALSYCISDMISLYNSVHHAEDTIASLVRARISNYVYTHSIGECCPTQIQGSVGASLDLSKFGLSSVEVYITEFAVVKTYRLIGDYSEYSWGKRLNTDTPSTSPTDQI